jgi:sugar lactone lactonase YvrE
MIRPSLVRLEPGQRQPFRVALRATYLEAASMPERVGWSVNGVPGGTPELGTIDERGVYTAPPKAPTPHEVHVGAEVDEAANRHLWATVLVGKSPEPAYQLVGRWAEPLGDGSRLEDPHGVTLDRDGHLLIADETTSRILRFTKNGEFLGEIGDGPGNEPGQFATPRAVEVDAAGRIWVSDSKGDRPRLQVFTPEGELLRIFGTKGIGPGQLLRAHGMGFDREQRLFVVDVDNFRVNIYAHDGEFLGSWGRPGVNLGELNAPHGLFVDPSGDVFVTSYYGPTQKFDPEGHLLAAFAHADPPDGPVNFHAVVGDRWGDVYLMVRTLATPGEKAPGGEERERIDFVKLNNHGDYVTAWALSEPDRHGAWAVVDDDGTVYALFRDETHAGVEIFEPR